MIVKAPKNLRKLALIGPPGTGVLEIIKVPQLNSDSSDYVLDIRPVKPGDGLRMDAALDSDDVPTLEHVRDMILNREEPVIHQGDDGGDGPSYQDVKQDILGR
jgi:hypothetical protein